MKRKKFILASAAVCLVVMLSAAACTNVNAPVEEATEDPYVAELYLPKVFVDDDGDLIQLTPNESPEDVYYFQQEGYVPYNNYYAKSDERGCKSCHSDLAKLLDESPYEHCALNSGEDTEWTISQCVSCHEFSNDYYTVENSFATMIHGIHIEDAECWNCHETSTTSDASDSTMYQWDNVRHQKLRGITDIADIEMKDTFTFTQDEISDANYLFNLNAQYYDWDYLRKHNTEEDVPRDGELIKDWTITISGEVERTVTFNLAELIATAPKETIPMKWHCVLNPTGGNGIGQVMATGIPLSYLTDQAGIKDTAVSLQPIGADGFQDHGGVDLKLIEGQHAMIVYEMNGEPLTWNNGYPCVIMLGGNGCGCYAKQVSDIVFLGADDPIFESRGWPDDEGEITNKPDVGIIGLKEGQVVKTDEPLTLRGYADAFDEKIIAVEFSMDRGKTWKRFDTPGTDNERWLIWEYQFTPDSDTAYCFAVRAVDESGKVTPTLIEKMFVSHANPAELTTSSAADAK